MDWNDIRLLCEIARTGSFRGAADALGVSKPTISRRINYMERRAGTRLFARTPHGAVPTEACKKLLVRATRIDDEVQLYERLIRSLSKSARPPVTARMTDGVSTYLMMPAIARQRLGPVGIAAAQSGIKLPTIRVVRPDAAEPADLQFIWTQPGEVPSSDVVSASDRINKLADIRFVPFVAAGYRRRVEGRRFDDLREHDLLSMHAYKWFSGAGWSEWHGILKDAGGEIIEADSSASLAFLIHGGAGVGLLPTYSPLCMDQLIPVDVAVPKMVGTLWLCCPEDNKRDATISQTFAMVTKLFRLADWMSKGA